MTLGSPCMRALLLVEARRRPPEFRMSLNQIAGQNNPRRTLHIGKISGRGQSKLSLDSRFSIGMAVGTSRAARPRTRAQRLIHDLLDGASAPAALCTATQTSINLPRRSRRHLRNAHRAAHVVVAQDVAGTNDHGRERLAGRVGHWIFKTAAGCKRKNRLFKRFQTMRLATGWT